MESKNFLYISLIFALTWVATHAELDTDKRYLKCHDPYEICDATDTVGCCQTYDGIMYTCQASLPVEGTSPTYRCLPPNSTGKTIVFPYSCHQPLEICRNIGCCNDKSNEAYVCAPYNPQYEPHKPALFPCEYRCEYKANQTMPVMPQEMCMANMTASSGESDM